MDLRRPTAIAGRHYPRDRSELVTSIEESFAKGPGALPGPETGRREIVAGGAPNSGMMFCGPTAAYLFAELKEDGRPQVFVIVGPDHYSLRDSWAVYPSGVWETPLGEVRVDAELAEAIVTETEAATMDAAAHRIQHSVEVHLPFLQYLYDRVTIVPIVGNYHGPEIGEAVACAASRTGKDVVLIASCHGSQIQSLEQVRVGDRACTKAIAQMDTEGFLREASGRTWNGQAAVAAAIEFARRRGASRGRLLDYTTTHEVFIDGGGVGDTSSVAAYLSFVFRGSPAPTRAGWDVFLSFKNSDPAGAETRDSQIAREVYDYLTSQGLRVFLSSVSLERLGVDAYSRAIDDALDTSQILLAIGTSREHLDSQWVRYEWDSFLNDIRTGAKEHGRVFAYIEGMTVRELPRPLRQCQTFTHGEPELRRLHSFLTSALRQIGGPRPSLTEPPG